MRTIALLLMLALVSCSKSPTAIEEPTALAGADSGISIEGHEDLPATTDRRDLPDAVGDLMIWSDKVVDLEDGRSLVLGRWSEDEPIETWHRSRGAEGLGEPNITSEPPIRLFLVDWDVNEVAPVSQLPETNTVENAAGESLFAEIPLEFEVVDGSVRYTVGFNGAGYDIPYSLWVAPIPPTGH